MRQVFGFPKDNNGGIVVNGTSMATVISMATARRQFLTNVRQDGIVNGPHLIVYASTEAHMCVVKTLEWLGFGSKALHSISLDDNFCIKIDELKKTMEDNRNNGVIPFAIIVNAGTVDTGAFDNLIKLSLIPRTKNMWFHVDGAFRSLVVLDPERCHLVRSIEHADSLTFDFHKWLHCPCAAVCVLIQDDAHFLSTLSVHQSYLTNTNRRCASDKPCFCSLEMKISRSFHALKVSFTLK